MIPAFYDYLAEQPGAVGLWVHPGVYGDLDEFEHRIDARDEVMSLLEIHIEDPDGSPEDIITRVEILSNHGEVAASMAGDDTVFDWSVTLESDTARYYYVRVGTASVLTGGDGVTAWTAPVWTGR